MIKIRIITTIVALVMLTACSEHTYPDLGEGYRFSTGDGNSLAIVNTQNNEVIRDEIFDFAFDSTYIIASQRPWVVPDIPGIENMTYDQRNEAFEESTFLQYWIINKKEKGEYSFDAVSGLARYSNVYGPFDRREYLRKRDELRIPKELQLKE